LSRFFYWMAFFLFPFSDRFLNSYPLLPNSEQPPFSRRGKVLCSPIPPPEIALSLVLIYLSSFASVKESIISSPPPVFVDLQTLTIPSERKIPGTLFPPLAVRMSFPFFFYRQAQSSSPFLTGAKLFSFSPQAKLVWSSPLFQADAFPSVLTSLLSLVMKCSITPCISTKFRAFLGRREIPLGFSSICIPLQRQSSFFLARNSLLSFPKAILEITTSFFVFFPPSP